MDLSFNSKMEAYYQKFFELQEKLRRSEEERLKLEMKFNELVQISREEEQAHYKKLRCQYKKFLEEDKKRQERNEKIIRALERIESRVNMLTSKTERINMLRRQYQSFLHRVSQKPVVKHDYAPPKITEELPSYQHKLGLDHDKKSIDITMLKKAYGKTNDEQIEILDKYLQNLKSQKDQVPTENKPRENSTDFDEMKYFDDVSKKLNEGFNSNKANSIAEDIMNSIYSRHYKTDLNKDEGKKVSKFTSPNYSSRYPDKDIYSGFGDSLHTNIRNNHPLDLGSNTKVVGMTPKGHDLNKFNENPYNNSINTTKSKSPFEEDIGKRIKSYENALKNSVDLSMPRHFKENNALPNKPAENIYGNNIQFLEDKLFGSSKTEMDLNENEKQVIYNSPTPEAYSSNDLVTVENNMNRTRIPNRAEVAEEDKTNNLIEKIESSSNNKDELKDFSKAEEPENYIKPEGHIDYTKVLSNNNTYESDVLQPNQDVDNVDTGNVTNKTLFSDKQGHEEDEFNQQYENGHDIHESNKDINDTVNSEIIYDDSGQQQQTKYENNDQTYDDNVLPYDQMDQYDSSDQPIEQLYGENGKALLQYDENGQAVYDQEYNDDGQSNQHAFEENDEDIPRYDSNAHEIHNESSQPSKKCDENEQPIEIFDANDPPIQQYDENSQPIQPYDKNSQLVQNYDENNQPIQQLDESGQLPQQFDDSGQPAQQYDDSGHIIQQYEENSQPVQQYDENGQLVSQYDENGQLMQQYDANAQPIQQYDENGQPIQQYDENGQLMQQYDVNAQPMQQYDENGQPLQQYDESGQPIQQYNADGQPIQQYDENGQPIQQYDENGQPVYYNQGDQLVQYDGNGQIIQQYDETGQPIAPGTYGEPIQHYDENGQPITEYNEEIPKEFDENGQPLQQYETNQYSVDQQASMQGNVEEQNAANDSIKVEDVNAEQAAKKKNVLDLLDTDSESMKQNTSKISNDSDFDFSNG